MGKFHFEKQPPKASVHPKSDYQRDRRSARPDDRSCEGFRMPAADERRVRSGRPASESLQGRKPRWGNVRRRRGRYGDLSAAGAAFELRQAERAR